MDFRATEKRKMTMKDFLQAIVAVFALVVRAEEIRAVFPAAWIFTKGDMK